MATRAGSGYSENPNSKEAGVEAARAAMAEAGLDSCDLVITFCTEKHDPVQFRDGVRSVVGPGARLIGGYAMGAITKDQLGYLGFQVGVAVLSSDTMQVDMFIEKGLPDNEYNVGRALGEQIASKEYKGEPNILLFYDSVKHPLEEGVALNTATPLIQGLSESIRKWPPLAGAGLFGGVSWNRTYQWLDDQMEQGSAMALVLSGGVRMDTIVMHGCKPSGAYHTVTKADDNVVLEIDGRRALDFVSEQLGPNSTVTADDYPFFITLGINDGDKFGEYKEDEYVNRLTMAVDKERGGLVMFEADLQAGSEIQMMRRSVDHEYVRERSQELLQQLGEREPVFAFYIDCGGRASLVSGIEPEEAISVQEVIGNKMPLFGFYSGVEVAKVKNNIRALDWSGILCVFSE
jgi:hypothetical protein